MEKLFTKHPVNNFDIQEDDQSCIRVVFSLEKI